MKTALRLFCCLLALSIQAEVIAQQTVVVPVAAATRVGNTTKWKMSTKVAGTVVAGGKSMAVDFQGAMVSSESYGAKEADGLYPVTSTVAFQGLRGTVDGKPQSMGDLTLPALILKIDDKGEIKSASSPAASHSEAWREQAREMAKSIALTRPPAGPVTVGQAITKTIEFPVSGSVAKVQVSFMPTEVALVGGEQAVKMQISTNSDYNSKATQVISGKPITITATGNIALTGGMSVGLATGEVIRQASNQTVVGTMDVGGSQVALQIRNSSEGYRIK